MILGTITRPTRTCSNYVKALARQAQVDGLHAIILSGDKTISLTVEYAEHVYRDKNKRQVRCVWRDGLGYFFVRYGDGRISKHLVGSFGMPTYALDWARRVGLGTHGIKWPKWPKSEVEALEHWLARNVNRPEVLR